jgi:hypothetical protein
MAMTRGTATLPRDGFVSMGAGAGGPGFTGPADTVGSAAPDPIAYYLAHTDEIDTFYGLPL